MWIVINDKKSKRGRERSPPQDYAGTVIRDARVLEAQFDEANLRFVFVPAE